MRISDKAWEGAWGLYTEKPLAFQHASENLRFPDVNSGTAFPAGFLPAGKAPSFKFRGDLSGGLGVLCCCFILKSLWLSRMHRKTFGSPM